MRKLKEYYKNFILYFSKITSFNYYTKIILTDSLKYK